MKTLQDAASYSYITKNEKGWAEVTIEFNPTIWDRLFFKGRGKEMVFIRPPGGVRWFVKDGLDEANDSEKHLIAEVTRLTLSCIVD